MVTTTGEYGIDEINLTPSKYAIYEIKEKSIYLSCECKSEVLKVSKFDSEDEVYLKVYHYAGKKYSFFERLCMLFKGKVIAAEIILNKKEFNKLKSFK